MNTIVTTEMQKKINDAIEHLKNAQWLIEEAQQDLVDDWGKQGESLAPYEYLDDYIASALTEAKDAISDLQHV